MTRESLSSPGRRIRRAERRHHRRIGCRVIVEKLGPSSDISAGGIRILTANPSPPDTEVRLAFELPESEESVQCHGRVVRIAPSPIDEELFEVGIQYQRMMARHREAIRQYVASRYDEMATADA